MEQTNILEEEATAAPPSEADNGGTEVGYHQAFCAELNQKLRTPLNVIIGFAELLSLLPVNKRSDKDVHQVLSSARELLGIIEKELGAPGDAAETGNGAHHEGPKCDVLYVEDDIVNYTLVERILEYRPGLRLLHADCGLTGLQMAEASHPKMVLLDLNLPDMHGSEVLQRLQDNPTTAEIPVVILSANATPSHIERLLTQGAKNYLTKPFDIDPFLAVVDEFVNCEAA